MVYYEVCETAFRSEKFRKLLNPELLRVLFRGGGIIGE